MLSSHKNKRMKKASLLPIPTADWITDLRDSIVGQNLHELRSSRADKISELPDPILCHILSFLPTKQAATTSVLSKRWKTLWLAVFTLDFNYETFKDFNSFRKFVDSTMFKLRDKKIPILSFSLKCHRSSHFTQQNYNKIFRSAMLCKVQNLNFDMSNKIGLTKLPPRILSLKMLQVLKLTNIKVGHFDQVDFPHLKTLHVNSVHFLSHEHFLKFLLGCPILEDMQYSQTHRAHSLSEDKDMTIENLSVLPNLVKVRIFNWNLHTPMTLICKAKILHMEKVGLMTWTKLPVFHNLTHLELSFKYHRVYGDCKSLLELLPHFPKLQHFKIQDHFGALSKSFDCWNDPSVVAECLSSHLKTCCIKGYIGSEYEFRLAKYIMQHSKVLEIMTIKCTCNLEKKKMLSRLSSCTMGSTKCKLLFD